MGVSELLERCRSLGLRLDIEPPDGLGVTPATLLTEELRQELRAHKPELVAALQEEDTQHRLASYLAEVRQGQHSLADFAANLPGVPTIHFSIYETEPGGSEADRALLRRIVATLSEYPGGNRIICTVPRQARGRLHMPPQGGVASPCHAGVTAGVGTPASGEHGLTPEAHQGDGVTDYGASSKAHLAALRPDSRPRVNKEPELETQVRHCEACLALFCRRSRTVAVPDIRWIGC